GCRGGSARASGRPAPAACPPTSPSPSLPPPAAGNHATCVMACHADRREARSQQPRGEGSEFNASRRSSPMRADGGLIGYRMAPAVYGVPAGERLHAALPAALWAWACLPARGADRAGDHLHRAPTPHRPRRGSRWWSGSAGGGGRAGPHDPGTVGRPVHCMRGENVTGARADRPAYRYRIRVRGRLGETICSAFPALQARASGGDTVLTGALPDRAALYGVLAQIEALGLEVLEVRRLPPV